MKKVLFALQFAIVAGLMIFMGSGSVYGTDGNLNKKYPIKDSVISVQVPGQTDDAKTRAHSVTNSTVTIASLSADATRYNLWIMNYSTPTVYMSATDTSSTTIVASGIKIPGYSPNTTLSVSTNSLTITLNEYSEPAWKVNLPNYTGALYFYSTDSGVTSDVRTLELRR